MYIIHYTSYNVHHTLYIVHYITHVIHHTMYIVRRRGTIHVPGLYRLYIYPIRAVFLYRTWTSVRLHPGPIPQYFRVYIVAMHKCGRRFLWKQLHYDINFDMFCYLWSFFVSTYNNSGRTRTIKRTFFRIWPYQPPKIKKNGENERYTEITARNKLYLRKTRQNRPLQYVIGWV